MFSELLESVVWCLSLILNNRQLFFLRIFHLCIFLFSPSDSPIIHINNLILSHSLGMLWFVCLFVLLTIITLLFQFGLFLLTYLQVYWFIPWLRQVYWWVHRRQSSSLLLCFSLLSFPFWFFSNSFLVLWNYPYNITHCPMFPLNLFYRNYTYFKFSVR